MSDVGVEHQADDRALHVVVDLAVGRNSFEHLRRRLLDRLT
jgi:hypothetical protein